MGLLLTGLAAASPPAVPPSDGWETLTEGDVTVACTRAGPEPWCRATGVIAASPDRVYAILDDIEGHDELFERLTTSEELEPGLARQVVALPFPLSPRDYVVRLDRVTEGADRVIVFSSIDRPDIPVEGVRLPRFAGEFRVRPLTGASTELRYTWQGELGDDIPGFALPIAWRSQGREIIEGVAAAVR